MFTYYLCILYIQYIYNANIVMLLIVKKKCSNKLTNYKILYGYVGKKFGRLNHLTVNINTSYYTTRRLYSPRLSISL